MEERSKLRSAVSAGQAVVAIGVVASARGVAIASLESTSPEGAE